MYTHMNCFIDNVTVRVADTCDNTFAYNDQYRQQTAGLTAVSAHCMHEYCSVQVLAGVGKEPCEVFDFICGTSTGGILAVLVSHIC
jgi:hypothetical protein